MIRKFFKWTGITVVGIVALLAVTYVVITLNINARVNRRYSFATERLEIQSDSATILRGRHLVAIKGCQDCHGKDLGGRIITDDGGVGRLSASNLTKGKGGLPEDYSTENWLTALRHGVDRTGKPLIFMPSHETTLLSAEDLVALIAYCQSVPRVDNLVLPIKLGPVANVMGFFDKMPLLSVEKIDHNRSMLVHADTTEGIAQGKYLAISCSGCHREDFKGGDPVAPGMPPVPNLTSTGNVGKWSQEQFIRTLRTGKTPLGHQMLNENMPWQMTAQYEQKELASLYQYFRSIE